MVDGNYRKGDMSASGINQANIARQNAQEAAKKAEDVKKEKLNADIRKYFESLGVNADKTKTITRMVDGKETEVVFGSDKKGNKVYIDANTGKEVVVTESKGKNKFTTKDKLEDELMKRFGMTSKDFADKKIIAEFKHGKIVLTDVKRGNQLPEEFLAQLENQHRADLAANRQPTPKELAYQAKAAEQQQAASAELAKTSAPVGNTITEKEFFDKMQAYAPKQGGNEEVAKDVAALPAKNETDKTAELKNTADTTVANPSSADIQGWISELAKANPVNDLAAVPKAKKPQGAVSEQPPVAKKSVVTKRKPSNLQGDKGVTPSDQPAIANAKQRGAAKRSAAANQGAANQGAGTIDDVVAKNPSVKKFGYEPTPEFSPTPAVTPKTTSKTTPKKPVKVDTTKTEPQSRKQEAITDGTNIAKAFNNTNRRDAYEPSIRAIKKLGKDNVMDFIRAYQSNAKGESHNIISTLANRGNVYGLGADAKAAALQLLKSVAQTPQGKNKGFEKIIADIEKNGLKYPFTQNADIALRKLDLSEPKPQGAKTPEKPAPKPKTPEQIENEKKYNAAHTKGKEFARKLSANSGQGFLAINDADLKDITNSLTNQYFRGFLRGMQSYRSINGSRSQFMFGVCYSKAASPQAKKDFALKILNSAKANSKNNKAYDALIKKIQAGGLTEATAKEASELLRDLKL